MTKLKITSLLMLGTFLGACAATTPTTTTPTIPAGAIGTASANADGTYTITVNSTTYELGAGIVAAGNTLRFPTPNYARGFSNADVTAIGGMLNDGTAFAGISGTASSSVPTGTATYNTRYTMVYPTASGAPIIGGTDGATTVSVDFVAGTVTNTSPYLNIVGAISGVTFSGTATCNYPTNGCAATVPMEGGFYGTGGIAGVYSGTGLAGAFYGTQNPNL